MSGEHRLERAVDREHAAIDDVDEHLERVAAAVARGRGTARRLQQTSSAGGAGWVNPNREENDDEDQTRQ